MHQHAAARLTPPVAPPVVGYRVVFPHRPRVGPRGLVAAVYPPGKLTYTEEEALEVLAILTRRWVERRALPPEPLTPYAVPEGEDALVSPRRFTLYDRHPWPLG